MRRRLMLAALACCTTSCAVGQDAPARPRQKISAAQLYESLSARFPLRLGLAGMFQVEITAPRLHLRPARNQLGAALLAELRGPRLARLPAGEMDVVFSLRYEASDQTVRAREPEILDVRWPGMPPETVRALQGLLPRVASDLGELVLHRFTPRELALPETMGLEPEEITVVDDGLLVFFGAKQPR
ncbi:MAG TPA: DUF1439 domain-containing protein [Ramlibacter sp.]